MSESHLPRKRFGQNFLRDRQVIDRIVSAIAPLAGETLLEIGPGEGALTQPLLATGARVVAVEIDRDLAADLRHHLGANPAFGLVEGDALRLQLSEVQGLPLPVRVVGNLPYNISTPLLFHLLAQRSVIRDMHFMLQKEVVDRLAAAPGGKEYGRLSVMVQYSCEVDMLFDVSPAAFYPAPKVMSAIVRLRPREPVHRAMDAGCLGEVVNAAFGQRRKTLRNTLRGMLDATMIEASGIDPAARAETLAVSDFVNLSNLLASARASHAGGGK